MYIDYFFIYLFIYLANKYMKRYDFNLKQHYQPYPTPATYSCHLLYNHKREFHHQHLKFVK